MGLFDKIKGEFIDVIEWTDSSPNTLVYRFQRHGNEIKNGAQLTVREGQTAVFIDEGQLADVFPPGMYTLETENLPVLSTLKGWKHGFESPFKAEVYFVSTRQITDLKWGTPNPVIMRDPDFGPIRVRAFGTYTLKALDPKRLLEELVGADSEFEAEEITVEAVLARECAVATVVVVDRVVEERRRLDRLVGDRVERRCIGEADLGVERRERAGAHVVAVVDARRVVVEHPPECGDLSLDPLQAGLGFLASGFVHRYPPGVSRMVPPGGTRVKADVSRPAVRAPALAARLDGPGCRTRRERSRSGRPSSERRP